MTSARHRCFSLLMAKDWFTSRISTSHYDTPGTFDKNHPVCHRISDSVPSNLKVKLMLQSALHMPKQGKKYTHGKLNTHKLNNQNAEKIVINRNEYSYILSFYTNYAKITLDSARHEQQLNTEHRKRKLKQKHVIY